MLALKVLSRQILDYTTITIILIPGAVVVYRIVRRVPLTYGV